MANIEWVYQLANKKAKGTSFLTAFFKDPVGTLKKEGIEVDDEMAEKLQHMVAQTQVPMKQFAGSNAKSNTPKGVGIGIGISKDNFS